MPHADRGKLDPPTPHLPRSPIVTRPGLAKARLVPLVVARRILLLRTSDASWRDLLERADIVSEGRVREEAQGRVWYGSTSLILPSQNLDASLVAAIADRDVHLRLRALRIAH